MEDCPQEDSAAPIENALPLEVRDIARLLDLAHDAIVVRDPRTSVIRYWNGGATALYGWGAHEATGQNINTLLRTNFRQSRTEVDVTLAAEGAWEGELWQVQRNGQIVVVESRQVLARDKQGQPAAVLEINRNVTALRLANERLAELLDAAPDAIVTVDSAGRVILANAQAESLFGYGAGELPGASVDMLVPDTSRALHHQQRAAYAAAPQVRPMASGLELRGRRKDGSEFPAEIRLSPLQTDEGLLVTAVVRDTSARLEAETRQHLLAEAGALLGRSLDEATTLQRVASLAIPLLADFVAIDVLDEAGRVYRAAMAHRDPEKEALVKEMNVHFPLTLQRETLVTRAIRTRAFELTPVLDDARISALSQDAEHLRLLRALGLRSLLVVPIVAREQPLGGLVLAYAESGRRYSPIDVPFAEELALRAALALDNVRLYRQSQEALAARDTFFAAASHDLRNPLAVIKVIAQTLLYQAEHRSHAYAQMAHEAAQIDWAVDRADGMVQQLLDFAQLQAGQPLKLRSRPTDLIALVHRVTDGQQQVTPRHHIRVLTNRERLIGDWDPQRLERVVINLVGNAVKYSPEGGPVTVRVVADGGGWVTLEVQDEGIGIPAQDLPRVFDPFHRASNVIGKIGGTGIGLTSSKQIVEQHGGTIAAANGEHGGTRFTVRLPILDPADDAPESAEM